MNTAVIGTGGIGSYLIGFLDKLISCDQLKGWKFTCYDDDKVETKNIIYQNFQSSDIDEYKTEALSTKYVYIDKYVHKRVGAEDLKKHDFVIICADNHVIRKEVYKSTLPFLDARCNGKTIGVFSRDTENYEKTLSDSVESASCQYPYAVKNKEIDNGNIIVASILSQCVLNFHRNKELPTDFIYSF